LIRRLPSAGRKEQPAIAARAHAQLEQLLTLGEISALCLPLVTCLRAEIDALDASDLVAISHGQAAAYAAAARRASRLAQRIRAASQISVPGAFLES
jgi:hypothetical protein